MPAKVITICQRKGGVGKSSSTLNLAYSLAEKGKKVLVVDLDDQQNTTTSISGHLQAEKTIEDLILKEGLSLNDVITPTDWPNVWMLPASGNLSGVIKHMDDEVGGHMILREKFSSCQGIDYIFLDTSPSLNILVTNAFCAADFLFIPLSSKYFSLQGLAQTLAAFAKVKKRLNPDLELLGMAFVIHDGRNVLAREIVEDVKKNYERFLFETMVGVNIAIEEAQVKKQSILSYAPANRGAMQYRQLGEEVLERIGLYG